MDTKHIVIATDFSERSGVALTQAMDIAGRRGADVTLLHVVIPPELWDSVIGSVELGLDNKKVMAASVEGAQAHMAELCAQTGNSISVTGRVEVGHPDAVIPRLAKELDTNLVVIGSRGHSFGRRLGLGTVAERVVRGCECNVLVARPRKAKGEGYNHILVPTDFSERADTAVAAAIDLVEPGGVIDIAHWWRTSFSAQGYYTTFESAEEFHKRVERSVAEHGEQLVAKFADRYDKINFSSYAGPAGKGIVEHMDSGRYDLVAIGSHGRRGIRRLLVGSVAETIAREAPCSVLVVHK